MRTAAITLDEHTDDQLEALARAQNRPKASLIADALRRYVERETEPFEYGEIDAFRRAVDEGLADVRNGRVVSHEEAEQYIRRRFPDFRPR
jgi:predicted transcriptional regulator